MPVNPGLVTAVPGRQPYYRITSRAFLTSSSTHHRKAVNGQGAVGSVIGARYNHPGVRSVYITEDIVTCLAEKMFYFQRETISKLDIAHHVAALFPTFQERFVLWEIEFNKQIDDIMDLNQANASAVGVYPFLMLNPSRDYEHLKARRAHLQGNGYNGLRAPSSRVRPIGNMVVLFDDQSGNVHTITPYEVEFRLITSDNPPVAFANHAVQLLDFTAGDVRLYPPAAPASPHAGLATYTGWRRVEFNQ
jgi:RES domain-containing protein